MLDNILNFIGQVSISTKSLAVSTTELSGIAKDSVSNVEQQQKQINLIFIAMNEMTSTVKEVANSATSATSVSLEGKVTVETSRKVVGEGSNTIKSLTKEIEKSSEVISSLEKESINIGGVF